MCEYLQEADKHAHSQSLMSPLCLDKESINPNSSMKSDYMSDYTFKNVLMEYAKCAD